MKYFSLICARGGSKGIKNKNLINFNGSPLLLLSINQAKALKKCSYVVVSTDSKKIKDFAYDNGADIVIDRPRNLANDTSPEILTWKHSIKHLKNKFSFDADFFVNIPTTSPLRKLIDIKKCISRFKKNKCNGVISITESKKNPYFNMVKINNSQLIELIINNKKQINRRQIAPKVYDITTVCYVFSTKYIMNNNNFLKGKISYNKVPVERSLDIDSYYDLKIANLLAK